MVFLRCAWIVLTAFCVSQATAQDARAGRNSVLHEADLDRVSALADGEIKARRIPGAVILIGIQEEMPYRRAFGNRVLGQTPQPMAVDTIFDIASITKVVATATAVMQLAEQGKIKLDEPAARYWPQFGAHGKQAITVRALLTHYSGLRAGLDLSREWTGYAAAMEMIVGEKPVAGAGARYLYSDVNYLVLGELVRRVSETPLDAYCREHIFAPLGMMNTGFLPPAALRDRIASTQDLPGRIHWGEVHDATARWMGGIAGNAGVFSTAEDLAIFARMMLHRGAEGGARVLSEKSARAMTTRQTSPRGARVRGFGWDLGDPNGTSLFSNGAYGHLGYTGGMIWIEPASGIYAIVLTNRTYPDGGGDAAPLRKGIVEILADAARRDERRRVPRRGAAGRQ